MLTLLVSAALAAKVPATVNIGIGPTVGALGNPQADQWSPAWGIALIAEGHVDGKTLHSKKVMRRVPKQYRGMVRDMNDVHVVPLAARLIPDEVMLAPIGDADLSILPVSWQPFGVSLVHKTKGMHRTLGVQFRGSYLRAEDADGNTAKGAWLGATLTPELQSPYTRRVGFALGGHAGPGYAIFHYEDVGAAPPWLDLGAYARLQLRFPIEREL